MVRLENLSYKDNIKNINYEFESNKITSIIGPSGSGKTLIFNLIENLIPKTNGEIYIENKKITKDLKRQIGYLFQNPQDQLFNNTVYEEIAFGLKHYHYKEDKQDKIIKDSLAIVGLNETYLNKNPYKLSYGEKTKVALATILALNPYIILLDEPTISLDNKSINKLISLLLKLKNNYHKTIIIASNDIEFVSKITDNIVILNKGKIKQAGDKNDILSNIKLLKENDIEIPKIIEFINLVYEKKGIKLNYTLDINELIKDIYRNV